MPTVNIISTISVFAVNGQAEAGDELQDSLRHEKRTGVVGFRAAIVSFTGDRYDRHVHRNAPHHVEQAHQQKYSSSYYESAEINLIVRKKSLRWRRSISFEFLFTHLCL